MGILLNHFNDRLSGKTGFGFRAARWFILRPKIPIWVYFGGPWNGKCWYF
jgi:hypothetical protein